MKIYHTAIYVGIAATAIAALSLIAQIGEDTIDPANPTVLMDTIETGGGIRLDAGGDLPTGGPSPEGMSNALYTLDESGEEAGNSPALQPEVAALQDRLTNLAELQHADLILEANRIMEALYRDSLLAGSGGPASAWAATPLHADKANELIEQFRHMHLQHLALLPRAYAYGDQDSLVVLGWSRIRCDVAKIHRMAAELRYVTALAPRNSPPAGLPLRTRVTHLYCVAEDYNAQAVPIVP